MTAIQPISSEEKNSNLIRKLKEMIFLAKNYPNTDFLIEIDLEWVKVYLKQKYRIWKFFAWKIFFSGHCRFFEKWDFEAEKIKRWDGKHSFVYDGIKLRINISKISVKQTFIERIFWFKIFDQPLFFVKIRQI